MTTKYLVVIDSEDSSKKAALAIFTELDSNVRFVEASEFSPVLLMEADFYFFGCAKSKPDNFEYFVDVLKHINLAGRECAVFSSEKGGIDFLTDIIKDSDVRLACEPLVSSDMDVIKKWVQKMKRSKENAA